MEEKMRMYIKKCRIFIKFMLEYQQWSGISKADIERWLRNFDELQLEELYLIYKLAVNIIYFSEKDVIDALSDGVNNRLYSKIVLEKQIASDFQLSSKAIQNIVHESKKRTCFTPLLDRNAPHESGNYVSRLLVSQGIVRSSHSLFLSELVDGISIHNFNRLVIVDDCLGTGNQLRDYWTRNAKVMNEMLSSYCERNNIKVEYLVLFGIDGSIAKLRTEFPELEIHCIKRLTDLQGVLHEKSYIWDSADEAKRAYALFEKITSSNGIGLRGYGNLDYAFIMHKTIPDWSLPLLWEETSDWKFLLRRKNSNV